MPTSAKNLNEFRNELLETVLKTRDSVRSRREKRGYVEKADFIGLIRSSVGDAVLPGNPGARLSSFEIQFVERAQFGADVTFRSTECIKADKNAYLSEICPAVVRILQTAERGGHPLFESVEQKGIYVNARLSNAFLFSALSAIESQGEKFGESSIGRGRDVVIDYSSPNAAKHLHAGHIRSTIIGHVLGNLSEAVGHTVHRVNYLNDWGGMGFLLEGLSRRRGDVGNYENRNDLLFEIYSSFRKAQKFSASAEAFDALTDADRNDLFPLFGDVEDFDVLSEAYADFKRKSDARFAALEAWDDAEFAAWREIVKWSMEDFERFYDLFGIHQDYLTGESLYAGLGKTLVESAVRSGDAVWFDRPRADAEIAELRAMRDRWKLTEDSCAKLVEEVEADIGGCVIELSNRERYVVLKGNESTIYATRDLAAIKHRSEVFHPVKIAYEVGQEQQDHFQKLFESARKLGFGEGIELSHVYHGYYVSEETKKKFSSREGAANIMGLLTRTLSEFGAKYRLESGYPEEEQRRISAALGIGSLIFNDLKRDKKSPIALSSDFGKMIRQFEESGGAYVIYASCRAKSIVRKYGKAVPAISGCGASDFVDQEIDLMKKLLEFPDVVERAAANDDPVRITEYLLKLSALYNAYYHAVPVLKSENAGARVALAAAVARVIDNGLRLLHMEPLERI